MQQELESIDTAIIGTGTILIINWFHAMDIETIYSLFVQSLVATATIGKLLSDWAANKRKMKEKEIEEDSEPPEK